MTKAVRFATGLTMQAVLRKQRRSVATIRVHAGAVKSIRIVAGVR